MASPIAIWSRVSANFPKQDDFKAMMDAAGFARTSYRNLSGGIVAIHSGWRI